MTLNEMQRTLSLPRIPSAFPALYEQMETTWQSHAQKILSDDFISQTLSDCYALAPYRSDILRGAQAIRTQPALCLLVCLLEAWLRIGGDPNGPEYAAPQGEGVGYDLLHIRRQTCASTVTAPPSSESGPLLTTAPSARRHCSFSNP